MVQLTSTTGCIRNPSEGNDMNLISTLDPQPACGHEECGSLWNADLGYVTDCAFTAPMLEVAA